MTLSPDVVATAAELACLLEVSAVKPGNVAPGRHFHDTRYEDFLASAAAIGPALARAGERPVGPTVLAAVQATVRWTKANTNLGIVLLFAPIARAALMHPDATAPTRESLRAGVAAVLDATTVADTRDVYVAIRLARPGGLGHTGEQDVAEIDEPPTATLRDVMTLAQARDAVAREYATNFATVFDVGVPALERARRDGWQWESATVETFLTLLAAAPDTLIQRKLGPAVAGSVSRQAMSVVALGGVRTEAGRAALTAFDSELRDATNGRNPGTTADLTAAAIFVALLTGGWTHA
jgi:triphosphoribosyl-dephospho-CoA synthase